MKKKLDIFRNKTEQNLEINKGIYWDTKHYKSIRIFLFTLESRVHLLSYI
jgi:hypothetical protein